MFTLKVFYFNLLFLISVISTEFNKFLILIKLTEPAELTYFI